MDASGNHQPRTATAVAERKCQAPTGTAVAQEPELRPKLSSSYRNLMVKA
jgi:hypothetical protein